MRRPNLVREQFLAECRTRQVEPWLMFLTSTGRHHGTESLGEGRLPLALDSPQVFIDVVSRPMRLQFDAANGCG